MSSDTLSIAVSIYQRNLQPLYSSFIWLRNAKIVCIPTVSKVTQYKRFAEHQFAINKSNTVLCMKIVLRDEIDFLFKYEVLSQKPSLL